MAAYDNFTLKVNPADLQNAADVVEKKVNTMKNLFSDMITRVNSTANYWGGDASDKYRNDFKAESPEFDEAFARMAEHARDLFNIAGIYTGVEKSAEDLISNLSSDVIV